MPPSSTPQTKFSSAKSNEAKSGVSMESPKQSASTASGVARLAEFCHSKKIAPDPSFAPAFDSDEDDEVDEERPETVPKSSSSKTTQGKGSVITSAEATTARTSQNPITATSARSLFGNVMKPGQFPSDYYMQGVKTPDERAEKQGRYW